MPAPIGWIEGRAGIVDVGHDGRGFAFDCEGPRHQALLQGHAIADRTVTNAEWMQFIDDGGYHDARLWLSDGWAWVKGEGIAAPLYWEQRDGGWTRFARRTSRDRPRRAGHACQLLRGGRLRHLGGRTLADRVRVGSGGRVA